MYVWIPAGAKVSARYVLPVSYFYVYNFLACGNKLRPCGHSPPAARDEMPQQSIVVPI